MADDDSEGELDPADAFLVPAHEIRVGILQALWRAENHALSFSELRKRVGVRDTGKFSYHLSKLEGRFVAHVEDRYELLYPGHRVIDAIQSGVYNMSGTREPIELTDPCPDCGASLTFTYRSFLGRVVCDDCGETVLGYPFDPGGFAERDDEAAVVRAFDRRTRRYWLSATDGVCPVCAGPTDARLVADATELQALDRYEKHYASDQPVLVSVDCRHCSFYSYVPAGVALLDHPAVDSAFHEADEDLRDRRLWTLPFVVHADRVELTASDSLEVVVTATPGAASEVWATVDATASVVAVDDE